MSSGQVNIVVRPFKLDDLDKVFEIECRSFPSPWTRFWFRLIHYHCLEGFVVAVIGTEIVGYAISRIESKIESKKCRMGRTGHLLNLAVDQRFRRQGIGKALIRSTIDYLQKAGAEDVWLEVRTLNLAARKLYSSLGFKETQIMKGYYSGRENAVIMTKDLSYLTTLKKSIGRP